MLSVPVFVVFPTHWVSVETKLYFLTWSVLQMLSVQVFVVFPTHWVSVETNRTLWMWLVWFLSEINGYISVARILNFSVEFEFETCSRCEKITASPYQRLSAYHVWYPEVGQGRSQGQGYLAISLICMSLLCNTTQALVHQLTSRPRACMCLMYSLWNKLTHYKHSPCLSFIVRQRQQWFFTVSSLKLFIYLCKFLEGNSD